MDASRHFGLVGGLGVGATVIYYQAILLAGTELNLIFDESTAGFPAIDCAKAHIDAIVTEMISMEHA